MPLTTVMNELVVSPPPPSCGKNDCCSDQTSSSSSIGKNSDLSEEKSDGEEEQVESKRGPLDAMDALEEVLPIRRGISRFYNGKSKTFASLIDASLSSVKEIAKPNNAYARRRRNLLAHTLRGTDIPKAPTSGRSTLVHNLAMATNTSASETHFNNWRSYSLSDLHLQQQCIPGASNPT